MRWRIKATFPTGPKNELRWHDGFVFDHNQLEREEGEGVEYQYTLFFPIDATDEVVSGFPHPSLQRHLLPQAAPSRPEGE